MSVLKPLQGEPLVFWHVGGEIVWRGDGRCTPIDARQAEALRELYGDEADAAYCAGDRQASRCAAKLWVQLTHALDKHEQWKRLFNPSERRVA